MRDQRGISNAAVLGLTLAFVAIVMLGVGIFLNSQINASTSANTAETARVAKCSFQFAAYRAQYSQNSNTALRPVIGTDGKPLPPYAGLSLPPAATIKEHLADNCQRYLVPFLNAAKEAG